MVACWVAERNGSLSAAAAAHVSHLKPGSIYFAARMRRASLKGFTGERIRSAVSRVCRRCRHSAVFEQHYVSARVPLWLARQPGACRKRFSRREASDEIQAVAATGLAIARSKSPRAQCRRGSGPAKTLAPARCRRAGEFDRPPGVGLQREIELRHDPTSINGSRLVMVHVSSTCESLVGASWA